MPKLIIAGQEDKQPEFVLSLRKQGADVFVTANHPLQGDWNLFQIRGDGTFISCGSLPKDFGLNIDSDGYPVVVRYVDKY
jgi:hypothetical protein